jgi:signal transduction histidine kinase
LIEGTLAAGLVLAVLLTIFPAYFIAGRALRPIREVSGLARRIEQTSDFSQRLQRDHSAEEIGELIVTFNDLIARIEHTLKSHNEFLADSSHELRRPLTNLRTNLDILRDPGLPAADRAACIDRMSHEAHAMSTLVGDLLLLTRDKSQAFDHGLVDLSAVCADTLSQCRMAFPGAAISSDIEPGITVSGDGERLSQMLRNLLENAVEYSSPGTPVELTLKASGSQAGLTVRDRGYGIPSSEIPHVFDRFYRGERARLVRKEGVGLGLAIARYVVEGHHGVITVESSTDGGTTFSVSLPVAHTAVRHLSDVLGVS